METMRRDGRWQLHLDAVYHDKGLPDPLSDT